MTTPAPIQPSPALRPRPARLWVWFLAGFLIVFVPMLFFVPTYNLHPSGRGLVRSNLWHYYALRIPKLFSFEPLGPGSGQSSAALKTLSEHVGCSALSGLVAVAIGVKFNRRRQRRTIEAG